MQKRGSLTYPMPVNLFYSYKQTSKFYLKVNRLYKYFSITPTHTITKHKSHKTFYFKLYLS